MGQARVMGRDITISATAGTQSIVLGEVDKFTAKKNDELKKSQPLGEKTICTNLVHMGWDLSFEGGKIDWGIAMAFHAQSKQLLEGGRSPYFSIKQVITYYNGEQETYEYQDVTIHGYELDAGGATEEMHEKFTAFATRRVLIDAGNTTKAAGNGYLGAMKAAVEKMNGTPSWRGGTQV